MKMRLESLVHAARQRYGAWAAIFILFAALCTLSVLSAVSYTHLTLPTNSLV